MIIETVKYTYNDLTIVPNEISKVSSRKECIPYIEKGQNIGMLPIFTAPMSTIVNEKNVVLFKKNGIIPIMPRNIGVSGDETTRRSKICDLLVNQKNNTTRNDTDYWIAVSLNECDAYDTDYWIALSLNEFEEVFVNDKYHIQDWLSPGTYNICIDLANGHMEKLYSIINKAREISEKKNYELIIMTGNIANPDTYRWIAENCKVDYIRVGIGSGNNCITTSNTGVHYPMASLVNDCYTTRKQLEFCGGYVHLPKIVADGGIRNYSDVIKALGLGADYVMIGSLFTGLLESAAPVSGCARYGGVPFYCDMDKFDNGNMIIDCWDEYTKENTKRHIIEQFNLKKESYGMSTVKAQALINPGSTKKTSEGNFKSLEVKYTLYQWVENMISYLKSAMSYTNSTGLNEFIGQTVFVVNSPNAISVVNK